MALGLKTLRFRFIAIFTDFVVVLFVVSSLFSVETMVSATTQIFASNGLPLARNVAGAIDAEQFKRLAESLDASDPYYETARQEMLVEKDRYA
jgi:hypothetical protein